MPRQPTEPKQDFFKKKPINTYETKARRSKRITNATIMGYVMFGFIILSAPVQIIRYANNREQYLVLNTAAIDFFRLQWIFS